MKITESSLDYGRQVNLRDQDKAAADEVIKKEQLEKKKEADELKRVAEEENLRSEANKDKDKMVGFTIDETI